MLWICVEGSLLKLNDFSLSKQKDTEDEVREIIRNNLHLQGKVGFWHDALANCSFRACGKSAPVSFALQR